MCKRLEERITQDIETLKKLEQEINQNYIDIDIDIQYNILEVGVNLRTSNINVFKSHDIYYAIQKIIKERPKHIKDMTLSKKLNG